MRYLHTMVRVPNPDESLDFYTKIFGLVETQRIENKEGRFTLVFLAAPGIKPALKLKRLPCLS